ncbi:FAD-dependent oxidoreductase [Nocardia sp. 004]|uniref:FAD-dependent oxidoreductase n=1 Tax=Nocardia sp. 004 TaxID=3385978 RepID=UPI0039A0C965
MVTIIGGGIAGTVLAGALARHGDKATLFEQQPGGLSGGMFLFIDERGHAALHDLGVDESTLHAASYPVTALKYVTSTGRRAQMSRGHRFWMRSALMHILTEFVADSGAELCYGQAVTDVTLTDTGCIVHRGDQTTTIDDSLVVAADGIDSVVRKRLEPNRIPVFAGDVVLYGITSTPLELPTESAVLHFFAEIDDNGASSSTLGHIWRPGDPNALWFIRIARDPLTDTDDLGFRPISEWSDTVLRAAPSNQALVGTLLEHTDVVHVSNARTVPLETAATPTLPVLLVGDADHAITPAAGVGARDALEDARAVYQAIISGTSPAQAMAQRRSQILADREMALRARSGAGS